jgi:hypothetical protein
MFICPFCDYKDIRKTTIIRHLLKIKKCNKEIDLELYNKAIDYLKENKYTFSEFPNEIINYKKEENKLIKKKELTVEFLFNFLEENPYIKKELLNKYSKSESTNTINEIYDNEINGNNNTLVNGNNNSINNYTLVYNNFGEEKIHYISEEKLAELCKSPYTACSELLKLINFNKEHIENFTIKQLNERSKYILIRKDNEWIRENKKEVLDRIISNNNLILSNFICNSGQKYLDYKYLDKIEDYFDVSSDENSIVYKNIAEKCYLHILNYSITMQNNLTNYILKDNILVSIPI